MTRMFCTARRLPGDILYRSRTARTIPVIVAVLLALAGALWSGITRAGRTSSTFGVTVRVLPQCDETKLGGRMETLGGRVVCVYPRIRQEHVAPDAESDTDDRIRNESEDTEGSDVIRSVEY